MGIAKNVKNIYKIGFHEQIVDEFWNVKTMQESKGSQEKYLSI